jgi:K+-transporting ATPase ATPase C chain
MSELLKELRTSVVALGVLTVLTGVAYPVVVTGLAKVAFAHQASGSLIVKDGKVLGSSLIGQPFDDPKYFFSRLSATSPTPYNASSSSGSNLGPTNPALHDAVKARIDALQALDPDNHALIPVDLVTASASGLDPDISPAAAEYEAARVARVRGVPLARVEALVAAHTEGRSLGVLGEPAVHVLELNLALDAMR